MPVNATTEYYLAEGEYHKADSPEARLRALQNMLTAAPKHKGAEKLLEQIKKRIKAEKAQLSKARSAGKGRSLAIQKEGAAQVVFVGLPNSGKSYILEKLSGAPVEHAEYPFTTRVPEMRMIPHGGIQLQGVELPAVYPGTLESADGPELFGVIRNSDFVVLVLDGRQDVIKDSAELLSELERSGIEISRGRREQVDFKTFIPGLILVNHQPDFSGKIHNLDVINFEERRLSEVKQAIWSRLGLIRIFTKAKSKVAARPVVLKADANIKQLAERVHKDFIKKFKFARVWGSGKFPGQQAGLEYTLQDGDVVEIYAD